MLLEKINRFWKGGLTGKKKISLFAMIILMSLILMGCSDGASEVSDIEITQQDREIQSAVPEWEAAYKEIVRNMEHYLADPYMFRQEPDGANSGFCIGYIGAHDFDGDNMPELIIGDDVSIGIFTYVGGKAKKIADLYEPEEWGYINGVYYRENTVILINSGSDGSCYVCLSYYDGEYMTGVYDEYNPQTAVVNGKEVTEEEFKKWFNLMGLSKDRSIPRSRIKKENGITTAFVIDVFQKEDEYIPIEELDFGAVEW